MRTLKIRVFPNAKKNEVAKVQGGLRVKVTAPATDGKANRAMVGVLSDFFRVDKNKIRIVRGLKHRDKIVGIYD